MTGSVSSATQNEWGEPVHYLTDDRDSRERHELVIMQAGNGDWYVSVLPEKHRIGPTVRLCTSGGASSRVPGLVAAIASAYRALRGEPKQRSETAESGDAEETIEANPKSLAAWKRRAEELERELAERARECTEALEEVLSLKEQIHRTPSSAVSATDLLEALEEACLSHAAFGDQPPAKWLDAIKKARGQ
jgi:hypothetical protein